MREAQVQTCKREFVSALASGGVTDMEKGICALPDRGKLTCTPSGNNLTIPSAIYSLATCSSWLILGVRTRVSFPPAHRRSPFRWPSLPINTLQYCRVSARHSDIFLYGLVVPPRTVAMPQEFKFVSGPGPPRAPPVSSSDWEKHRAAILHLWVDQDLSLSQLMDIMRSEHNFTPS